MSAIDAHRQHRGGTLGDEQTHAGFRLQQLAVRRARALWKDEHFFTGLQETDCRLQAGGIRLVPVDRNGLPFTQNPPCDGMIK